MAKKILVIDSGGRGHAIAWKLSQEPDVKLFIAPGNGGTQNVGENVDIGVKEIGKLVEFAEQKDIDLTVASQDNSLALGVVDAFQVKKRRIFGPTRSAAMIESSKALAKCLMNDGQVPTAPSKTFRTVDGILAHVRQHGGPIVIKASGLALGKGVYVCQTVEEAQDAIADIMVRRVHGDAGNEVIAEGILKGKEISIHAFCDGKDFLMFPSAQDHKPALDNDQGRNTGGMGTIAPVPWVSQRLMQEVSETIVSRILTQLSLVGKPFVGCLYPGLMITADGPKVLEFNARPGDTEMQSYMRLLDSSLLEILEACVDGTLGLVKNKVKWNQGFVACIALASDGYPGPYAKGLPISGIEAAEKIPGVVVFHAGTCISNDGVLITSGGRVLNVTATGPTLEAALQSAYHAVGCIYFANMQFRHDIGAKSLQMTSVIDSK
jgi:phosphoribosylamine--glycine ligase